MILLFKKPKQQSQNKTTSIPHNTKSKIPTKTQQNKQKQSAQM